MSSLRNAIVNRRRITPISATSLSTLVPMAQEEDVAWENSTDIHKYDETRELQKWWDTALALNKKKKEYEKQVAVRRGDDTIEYFQFSKMNSSSSSAQPSSSFNPNTNTSLSNTLGGDNLEDDNVLHGESGFRASEIAFLQEQNTKVLGALENIETERDNTLRLVREWEDKEQQMLIETDNVHKRIKVLQDALVQEKTELIAKDEPIPV